MLSLSGELGLIIAIPLVVLVLIGIKLDRVFSTFPLFTVIGMLLSLTVSSLVIARKIKEANANN